MSEPAEPIVVFRDVGKSFRRFDQQPFLLRNLALGLVGKAPPAREFWPLRNITFTIGRGETTGVIGTNGSGKSTLLRLIAGAAYPSEGHIAVRGRVAPLLALGAGFNLDMTGRECVDVNGMALGLSPEEIAERKEAILQFAELTDFVDTPVRYYSSGMLARLGFAIAVHAEPDLLLVDEVLAVGDHAFQQRCINRINELREKGMTLLFVSHDPDLTGRLCTRVMWLSQGRIERDGPPGEVIAEYLRVAG